MSDWPSQVLTSLTSLGVNEGTPATAGAIAATLAASGATSLRLKHTTDTGEFLELQNAAGASLMKIGHWPTDPTYLAVGLSGTITGGTYTFLSKPTVDLSLYINRQTGGHVIFRENNVGAAGEGQARLLSGGAFEATLRDKGGQVYNVLSYGLVADSAGAAAANSTALAALIAAIGIGVGGTIFFPPGTWYFATQITILNRYGLRFIGPATARAVDDTSAATLLYTGAGADSLLHFDGAVTGEIGNLNIGSHGRFNLRALSRVELTVDIGPKSFV